MDAIINVLRQTEEERKLTEDAVVSRRSLFSKWKLKIPKKEKQTEEAAADSLDVDPEILKRVDRALQLVSQFRPPPAAQPASPPPAAPKPPSAAPRPAQPRQSAAGDSRPQRGRAQPRRPASRPPLVSRPPAAAHRPAHQSAPFKTEARLSSALYRRAPPARLTPATRGPSQGEATARLHSGRATTASTARRWMQEEKKEKEVEARRKEEERKRREEEERRRKEEERKLASPRPHRTEAAELRRSFSAESLPSPRTSRVEEERMEFDAFIRCVPIPSKFRREVRLSRSLLDKSRQFLQAECASSQRFLQLLEESSEGSRKSKMEQLGHQAAEIERRFRVFDQVQRCIDLERASAEQLRWCWQWLLKALEEFATFQAALRGLGEAGSLPVLEAKGEVESFLESAHQRVATERQLTPEDVYWHVGGQRSAVHYKDQESLLRMTDLHSRLYKLQQMLQVSEGLAHGLGDLERIVRRAENPATAYRQLCGLLIDRFPVMILDDG